MILLKNYFHRLVAVCLLVLLLGLNPSFAQRKEVEVTADGSMKQVIRNGQKVVLYIHNVKILHEGAQMTCDSAYLSKKQTIVEAFGRVVMTKDDATLYGDYLYYDGNTSLGNITGKEVRLVQKDATLTTDVLYFNTKSNSAYYNTGGFLRNSSDTLNSKRGYYYSHDKKYYFAGNVDMRNKDGHLLTDSLEYESSNEIAHFYGATRIYNKENFVYCEKGWYDKKKEQSDFSINAFMTNKKQRIYGQSIFYDKQNGYAHAKGQVALADSIRKLSIYGDEATYWDKKKEAEVTGNPLLEMDGNDDTLYLKAEKFYAISIPDSTLPDSTYRILKAIKAVKYFRKDVQGLCDSLIYNTKDSTVSMFVAPVIWNENNQISADFIKAYSGAGNKIRKMDFDGSSFITSKEDSSKYNQVRGKTMVAHFVDGKMNKLDITGNGQTVYYLKDKDKIVAVNKAESTDLTVYINNNKISRIKFIAKPVATLYPIEKADSEELILKGFKWLDEFRPKTRFDIIPEGVELIDAKPVIK